MNLLPDMVRAAMNARKDTTRETLARESGLSARTIDRLLSGQTVSPDTHAKLIAAFEAQGITFRQGRGWWKMEVRG